MSINLYPGVVHEADLSPDFGTEIDDACRAIRDSVKGWGTREKKLIKAIAKSPEERTKISHRYKSLYGKDLEDVMKKECGGDFGRALQLLALPPDAAEAKLIKMATDGLGAKKKHLYPIVCGRSNAEIDILKRTYFKTYGKDLGALMGKELGGDIEKLLFNCIQGCEEEFDPHHHTEHKALEDAEEFYKAGQNRFGTDEKTIFKIVCYSPPQHLRAVDTEYAKKHGYTLMKAVEKELGGTVEEATLFTLGMKLKPYETVAGLMKSSCDGAGTDELLLTACIVRYQNILTQVMIAYMELYGTSVQDLVKKEVRGDYRALLLEVLEQAMPGM